MKYFKVFLKWALMFTSFYQKYFSLPDTSTLMLTGECRGSHTNSLLLVSLPTPEAREFNGSFFSCPVKMTNWYMSV